MIPAQYQLVAKVAGVLVLMAAAAGVVWWGMAPRIDIEDQRAGRAEQQLADAQAMIELQAGVLAQQQHQLGQLADVDRRIQQLGQTINRNQAVQSAALEELKRNDQAVAVYLSDAVPGDLGQLYARPETTDPAAYRGTHGVQPGAVPAARPTGAGGE